MNNSHTRILLKTIIFIFLFLFSIILGRAEIEKENELAEKIKQGIHAGKIAYRLTEPEEVIDILGQPDADATRKEGGMLVKELRYPGIVMFFWKMRDDLAPFTLRSISVGNKNIDIGRDKKLVLRNNKDLPKIDAFQGFQNVSLLQLDLRDKVKLLKSMLFDTLTEWPPAERMPEGFSPTAILESGKNPGLGLRSLHEEGLDGRGIGIAIIDQPLLLGHFEYTSCIARYDATGLVGYSPAMHGSPVTSIAVGKTVGVAPRAILTYFAVPMWEEDNSPYIAAMNKIFTLNESLPEEGRIRAVSISTGMFPHYPHFDEWKKILDKAESLGILVVTCDQSELNYGMLSWIPGTDPDVPENYRLGKYHSNDDVVRIPGGCRTLASHRGIDVYWFGWEGGMSWGAPYIAGLAVLAYQVNPKIRPHEIINALVKSTAKTEAGPVVNPKGFLNLVRQIQ